MLDSESFKEVLPELGLQREVKAIDTFHFLLQAVVLQKVTARGTEPAEPSGCRSGGGDSFRFSPRTMKASEASEV